MRLGYRLVAPFFMMMLFLVGTAYSNDWLNIELTAPEGLGSVGYSIPSVSTDIDTNIDLSVMSDASVSGAEAEQNFGSFAVPADVPGAMVRATTSHFVQDPDLLLQHADLPSAYKVLALTAGDIDQDGLLDVVAIIDDLDVGTDEPNKVVIVVLRNITAAGSALEFVLLDTQVLITTAEYTAAAAKLADIDNDEQLELMFTLPSLRANGDDNLYKTEFYINQFNANERIMIRTPELLYFRTPGQRFSKAYDFEITDLNDDGFPDIFTAEPTTNFFAGRQLFLTGWQDPQDSFRFVGFESFEPIFNSVYYRFSLITDPQTTRRKSAIAWNGTANKIGGSWGLLMSGGLYDISVDPAIAENRVGRVSVGNFFGLQFDVNGDGLYEYVGDMHVHRIKPVDSLSSLNNALFTYESTHVDYTQPGNCNDSLLAIFDVDSNGAVDYLLECPSVFRSPVVVKFMQVDGTVKRIAAETELLNGNKVPYADNDESAYMLVRDFNADGHLDVIGMQFGKLWFARNTTKFNQAPSAPTGLGIESVGEFVDDYTRLSWQASVDDTTLGSNLRYNAMLYRHNPGDQRKPHVMLSPMASKPAGVTHMGHHPNVGYPQHKDMKNLPVGDYYWAVQAVDTSYATSSFSLYDSFTISREAIDYSVSISTLDLRTVNSTARVEITIRYESDHRPLNRKNVVVHYRKPVGMDIVSASGRGIFNPETGNWTLNNLLSPGSAGLGPELTLTIELANYELSSKFEHWAEIVSSTNDDPDSTPGNYLNGQDEDDFAYERLSTFTGFADLTLTSSAVEQKNSDNEDEFLVTLVLTNNGVSLPVPVDVNTLQSVKRVVVEVDDDELFYSHDLQRCSRPDNYNATHKLWLEKDLAVGESRTIELKYCVRPGGSFPSTGTFIEHYAEIINASQAPLNPLNTYGNNSQVETDDAPINHLVVSLPEPVVVTGSYIREFCWRVRSSTPLCYTMSYYKIKNVSENELPAFPMKIESAQPGRLYYHFSSARQFDAENRQWNVANLAAGQTAMLYTMSMRQGNSGNQSQQLMALTDGFVQQKRDQSRAASPQVLEHHQWESAPHMTYINW